MCGFFLLLVVTIFGPLSEFSFESNQGNTGFSKTLTLQDPKDFIIDASGEKVYGKVISKFDLNNYEFITFSNGKNKENKYYPDDILGFGLENGRCFLSENLPDKENKVFFQVIFSGRFDLLSYKGRYFIDNGDSKIELKGSYESEDIAGGKVKRYNQKPFAVVFNRLMSGNCGTEMYGLIVSIRFNEKDFISLLEKFHECEGIPFQTHVEKIPYLKISPMASFGLNFAHLLVNFKSVGSMDVFENNVFPMIQGGIKVHQYRKAPRFTFDAGLGINFQNNTIHSEAIKESSKLTGSEKYNTVSIFTPLFVNYTFLRVNDLDFYVGLGAMYRFLIFKSKFAIVEESLNENSELILREGSFLVNKTHFVSPMFKVGTHILRSKNIGIVSELQVDYSRFNFVVDHNEVGSVYNQVMVSYLVGVRF